MADNPNAYDDAVRAVIANQLVLARITGNHDAYHAAADEVPDCAHCWRRLALNLADQFAAYMAHMRGYDEAAAHITDQITFLSAFVDHTNPN
jgi:hypothetical protein